jgi:excisionase family DNA binding protein
MGIGNKLTTAEAAAELGKSIRHIQWLITEGKLPAEKVGRDYFIKSDDLRLVRGLKRGRPPKTNTETSSKASKRDK